MYHDSSLLLAVTEGELPTVKYLLRAGANVNARGGTSLIIAAERGDLTMVKYLYTEGARGSEEALITAFDRGHGDVVEFLLDMRGDVSTPVVERLKFLASSLGDMWRLIAKYS